VPTAAIYVGRWHRPRHKKSIASPQAAQTPRGGGCWGIVIGVVIGMMIVIVMMIAIEITTITMLDRRAI
jgi:hypothetical protein